MITHNYENEQTEKSIICAMKALKISQFLRQANIRKSGINAYEIFSTLLTVVFLRCTLFQLLNSGDKHNFASKNTYYRFLNNKSFNWFKFLFLLSEHVISRFSRLTSHNRAKFFVIDDSTIHKDRNSKGELLARTYDHVIQRFCKGYTLLTVGWTDGFSFVPVSFNMLSSPNFKNRYNEISDDIDRRTNAYKFRKESMMQKPDAVITMLIRALNAGIVAQYVLMDTWFTTAPLVARICNLGLHVIGMVKRGNHRYEYNGKMYTLRRLYTISLKHPEGDVLGSLYAHTNNGVPIKLVFIRNRNRKSDWLCILSTDITLDAKEVVRYYQNRWSIECFFKASKSCLKLGKEFQNRDYSTNVSSTAIVFTRYIVLEWMRRQDNDIRTQGALFRMVCAEVQDVIYEEAIMTLLKLILTGAKHINTKCIEMIKSKVIEWIDSQHRFGGLLSYVLRWES